METTKLSSKGQVVLPKSIRQNHQWTEGIEFIVEDLPEGVLLRPIKTTKFTTWDELVGCANYHGPAKSLAEIEQAIAQGVKKRHVRGRY